MKTILCYGDSNTWGYVPGKANYETGYMERYSRDERWPGLLQKLLGNDYYVVEEGLNSRTTNLDYKYPPNRNGKTYLPPCLYSHAPIDLVILSLGANDLKPDFKRSATDICAGLGELVEIIKTSKYGPGMQSPPKILIFSQPIPLPICKKFLDNDPNFDFEEIDKKTKALISLYEKLAKEKGCFFLDVTSEVQVSNIDGMHLDKDAHKKLAHLVSDKIKKSLLEQEKLFMEDEDERVYSVRSTL